MKTISTPELITVLSAGIMCVGMCLQNVDLFATGEFCTFAGVLLMCISKKKA